MAAQPAVRNLNYALRLKTSVLLLRVAVWRKAPKTVFSACLPLWASVKIHKAEECNFQAVPL